VCLVEIVAAADTPPPAPRWRRGAEGPDRGPKATQLRRGVMGSSPSPARLPDLPGQRTLRAQDMAGELRLPLRASRPPAKHHRGRSRTRAAPTSPSTPSCASSARAACGPAMRSRARWR
jgi:hypothetical protein